MADTKISALTDGAPAQGTEDVPVALSGANYRLTTGDIALLALQDTFQGAITVDAATTGVLAGSPTYSNGAAGVGATLTKGSNGAFPTIDGHTAALNNTYLVKNQADQKQNGVYLLTTLGTAGTPWVLTRTTDSDQTAEFDPQVVIPANGTVNKRKVYSQTTASPTIGTDNIVYATTPTTSLAGYVKRDGTVDFIGTETWDFGGTDTTTIADTGINISDASDSMNVDKTSLIFNDISNTGSISKSGVGFSDTAGNATQMSVSSFKITQAVTNAASEKKFIKVSLSAAQIQNGNTTPIDVIADPGGGKVIDLISCVAVNNFGTQAFSNTQIHLDCGGGNGEGLLYSTVTFVNAAASTIVKLYPNTSGSDNAIMTSNSPVKAMFDGDSVGFGDGTIDLYIEYNIITL